MITYSVFISAYYKGVRQQRALQRFEVMLHHGLLPKVITYSVLISTCDQGALYREP